MATRGRSRAPQKKLAGDYRHGDLRNALLDAAAELVATRGGPDFSLREIAARVGVRHAAAYRHFASKEAIVSALSARAFERMAERFKTVEERVAGDVLARIEGLADAYFSMVRDEPGAYRVMCDNLRVPDAVRNEAARKCFETLLSAITEGQHVGLVRDDLPAIAIAASNWAPLHGLAMLLLDRLLEEDGAAGGSTALLSALRLVQREGWSAKPMDRSNSQPRTKSGNVRKSANN
jgi:AcrR family transcriptional regulator